MTDVFLWGPLCHPPLIRTVLGREIAGGSASLPGFDLRAHDRPGGWPDLVAGQGQLEGLLLRGLSDAEYTQLDFYARALGGAETTVTLDGGVRALAWLPDRVATDAPSWQATPWATAHGALTVAGAEDIIALIGQQPPALIARRYTQILVRAASRLRNQPRPTSTRHHAAPGDLVIDDHRQPYAHFFAVDEYDMRFRRFDGSLSAQINRAVFISGDAVTVLPYDPARDRVLLIEQFRAGPMGRGDSQPWLLEAIAGRIDPGETPEAAARREAVEEAGLTLGALEQVAGYYPSPAAKTEYVWSYLAVCDLPDGVAGVFGVEGEVEDIRGHLISFDAFMTLVASGEVDNGPLLITALWLQRERARLRAV